MSLTSTLRIPEVHKFFAERINFPSVDLSNMPIVVKRRVQPDQAARMGTALDYAIRFVLERRYGAKRAGILIAQHAAVTPRVVMTEKARRDVQKTLDMALAVIRGCKTADSEFAWACYQLANLDLIIRQGHLPAEIPMNVPKDYIDELRLLLSKAVSVWPKPEQYCLLNPTFGRASSLVGGADADVIQDDCIYDFKCVNKLEIREPLMQLVGYYVLSQMGGVDGATQYEDLEDPLPIKEVCVYFARHVQFLRMNITDLVTPDAVKELQDFLLELGQEPEGDTNAFDEIMFGYHGDTEIG